VFVFARVYSYHPAQSQGHIKATTTAVQNGDYHLYRRGKSASSLLFVQIFAGNIILRHLMRDFRFSAHLTFTLSSRHDRSNHFALPHHREARRWWYGRRLQGRGRKARPVCRGVIGLVVPKRHIHRVHPSDQFLDVLRAFPDFGFRARVPPRNGKVDRTEVDMRA